MVPKKIGNANGMQISIDDKGHTRNMFVYAERSQVSIKRKLNVGVTMCFKGLCINSSGML